MDCPKYYFIGYPKKLPVDVLNTYLFNSQSCENTFRVARALSGPYSSIINFTVKSYLNKCEKISIINSIKTRGGQLEDYHFKSPQHHKHDKEAHTYSNHSLEQFDLTEVDFRILYFMHLNQPETMLQ